MPIDLRKFSAVLLDLDGTVYHEEEPIPAALACIRRLEARGQTYACLTNSTSSPRRISERLKRMGLDIDPVHIYTAAASAADYVIERFAKKPGPLPRVFNLATEGLAELLAGRVQPVRSAGESCDAVICGAPGNVLATEDRRQIALELLRAGALLVGICADRIFPSPRGIELGAGALTHMLAYAAGVEPVFCGKPQLVFFHELCRRLQVKPGNCVLVGDNLESDIFGGKNAGIQTILTLTGVTSRANALAADERHRPGAIITDMSELL